MWKRSRRIIGAILIAVTVGLVFWMGQAHRRGVGWNVVVITLDTTRADHLGCYSASQALTPVLDGLARDGVLFERAYATAPLTLSSHASMFTGLLPPEHGLTTNGKGRLAPEITTLAEALVEAGYATSAFVASYVLNARFGLNQGFQDYDDDLSGTFRPVDQLHRERHGDVVIDSALDWLSKHKSKTFHCWIHLYDPHFPYIPHEDLFGERFLANPYDAEIAFVDQQVGRIRSFLETEKLDSNTLIVIVGDHGEGLNEHNEKTHSYQLYNSTMQVPLIVVTPDKRLAGQRIPQAVSLVDLTPTVLDLLQLPTPRPMTGLSIAGPWRGQPIAARDCFSMTDEPYLDNQWSPLRSVTTDRWKYIRTPDAELYDLHSDPSEQTNVFASNPEQVAEMEERLATIETKMTVRETSDTEMSAREKRTLASLGYTGGLSNRGAASAASTIDVKAMMPLYNKLSMAIELLEHGQAVAAEPGLREVVVASPAYLKALGNLGICLAQQQKWDEAIECYLRVLAIDPQDVSALMNLGAASAANGRTQEAIDFYSRSLQADSGSSISHFRLGQLRGDTGDFRTATYHFKKAVELDPEFDEAQRAWGDLAVAQDDLRSARMRYDAALTINPKSVPAMVNRGILDARIGNTDSAYRLFQRAIKLDPQNVLTRSNLGLLNEQQGKTVDAIMAYEAVLRQAPDHFPTLLSLGWIRATHSDRSLRRPDQAIELAERACDIAKHRSLPAFELKAAACAEAGKFDEAAAAMEAALNVVQPNQRPSKRELEERAERYRRMLSENAANRR